MYQTVHTLTGAQVREFVRGAGLSVRPNSPLQVVLTEGTTDAPNSEPLAVDTTLADLLARLAAPDHQVRIVIAGPVGTNTMLFYGDGSNPGELVSCRITVDAPGADAESGGATPEGPGLEIGDGWTPRGIAMLTGLAMDPIPDLRAGMPKLHLSASGLLALMATLDAYREQNLEALLYRTHVEQVSATPGRILRQAEMSLSASDPRWLVSLLRLASPIACNPNIDDLTPGFNEILSDDLLGVQSDGRVLPSEPIRLLLDEWSLPLPAVATEVTVLSEEGTLLLFEHQLVLRGATQTWRVSNRGLLDDRRVQIEAVDAPTLLESLEDVVTPQPLPPEPGVHSGGASEPAPIPAVAPELMPADDPRFCPRCSTPLRPGAPFCGGCGAPAARSE